MSFPVVRGWGSSFVWLVKIKFASQTYLRACLPLHLLIKYIYLLAVDNS